MDISQAAQRVAPKSGSAFIQATAQEGRAWARLGDAPETRAGLGRVAVAGRGVPEATDLAEAYHEACGEDGPPALP